MAHFINDIVTGAESREAEPGRFISHDRLYPAAMAEIDANVAPMQEFERALSAARVPRELLAPLPISEAKTSLSVASVGP